MFTLDSELLVILGFSVKNPTGAMSWNYEWVTSLEWVTKLSYRRLHKTIELLRSLLWLYMLCSSKRLA